MADRCSVLSLRLLEIVTILYLYSDRYWLGSPVYLMEPIPTQACLFQCLYPFLLLSIVILTDA